MENSLFNYISFYKWWKNLDKFIFTVKIFLGLFFAIFSMSIPPCALEIKAIFELDLSIRHDK